MSNDLYMLASYTQMIHGTLLIGGYVIKRVKVTAKIAKSAMDENWRKYLRYNVCWFALFLLKLWQ